MPKHRRNPLPKAPPRRRAPGLEPTRVPASTLARVRQMASQVDERDRPFSPERAPTWRGSRGDLVVNGTRMDDFTRGFLQTALWSSNDESRDDGGDPLDDNYSIGDIEPESLEELIADCQSFQEENADTLAEVYAVGVRGSDESDEFSAGHDFWLTRNGHGAGFWDGDYPEPQATQLDEASKRYGEVDLTVDDGKIFANFYKKHRKQFTVVLEDNDDEESVTATINGPGAAKFAKQELQSLGGSSWESDGPDFAYVVTQNQPGLVKELEDAGVKVDDGQYTPPDYENNKRRHRRNPPVDRRDVPHNLRGIEPRRYSDAEMPTENGDSLRYEQIDNCDDADCEWFTVGDTEGGDYSGGTVARSNYRKLEEILEEQYPNAEPAVWGRLRGSHGSQGIIIKYGDLNDEVRGTIDALSDYPLIDENDHSELEYNEEQEYWDKDGREEFCKELGKLLGMRWPDELQEHLPDEQWDQVFEVSREAANEYWEPSSEGPYIRIERIAGKTIDLLGKKLGHSPSVEQTEAFVALEKVIANLPSEE